MLWRRFLDLLIEAIAARLLDELEKKFPRAVRLAFDRRELVDEITGHTREAKVMIRVPFQRRFRANIVPRTASGGPSTLDFSESNITAESSNPGIVAEVNGLEVVVRRASPDFVGGGQVTVTGADADLDTGPGEQRILTLVEDFDFLPEEAATIGLEGETEADV